LPFFLFLYQSVASLGAILKTQIVSAIPKARKKGLKALWALIISILELYVDKWTRQPVVQELLVLAQIEISWLTGEFVDEVDKGK